MQKVNILRPVIKILALGPKGSNAHKAARTFARSHGLKTSGYMVVFCKNHRELFRKFTRETCFAIVPVENSIHGKVKGVAGALNRVTREYNAFEMRRFTKQIKYCLATRNGSTVERVISHPQALGQCSEFIQKNCFGRSRAPSTSAAAELVAKSEKHQAYGAICSEESATENGLSIRARDIQNPKNRTTFAALSHVNSIASKKIAIYGGKGAFGRQWARRLKDQGCTVSCIEVETPEETQKKIVKESDVVMISTPTLVSPLIAKRLARWLNKKQLVIDLTSVKVPVCRELTKSQAEFASIHMMFAPSAKSWKGQNIPVCKVRICKWKKWLNELLNSIGGKTVPTTQERHDRIAMIVQQQEHFLTKVKILATIESGVSIKEILAFASPFYQPGINQLLRFLAKPTGIYTDMLEANENTPQMLSNLRRAFKKLDLMVKNKRSEKIKRVIADARTYFGKNTIRGGDQYSEELIADIARKDPDEVAVIEFTDKENQAGLLAGIANVFKKSNINQSGFKYRQQGRRHQFLICFDDPKDHPVIQKALAVIRQKYGCRVG